MNLTLAASARGKGVAMPAREITGKVIDLKWLTPTVVGIRFESSRRIRYEAGQFLSVAVPHPDGRSKPIRRAYSFAVPPEVAKETGHQLCIKVYEDGLGSNYMASLRPGNEFKAFAPYGDLIYEPRRGRGVCFISTGTGIAPFRAMLLSDRFREEPPVRVHCIFGARTADEIIYPGLFESMGVETVCCVSRPEGDFRGFKGRVTDYLRSLPLDWPWQATEFYICGNGEMIADVRNVLRQGRNVPAEAIHQEVYFSGGALIAA